MNSPVIVTLAKVLARGEREGVFRHGVDPLQLYVSIAALAYFFLSNNHTLSAIFGRDLSTPAARRTRLTHMTAMVLGFLRPGSPDGRAALVRGNRQKVVDKVVPHARK